MRPTAAAGRQESFAVAMMPQSPSSRARTPRAVRRVAARAWIARALLLAFAWASLGPWPWLAIALGDDHHAAVAAHEHDAGDVHEHRHRDASEIPGAPTHPADHDCLQCQMLAHLARCIPASPPAVAIPAIDACAVLPWTFAVPRFARAVALLPPVRAPPVPFA